MCFSDGSPASYHILSFPLIKACSHRHILLSNVISRESKPKSCSKAAFSRLRHPAAEEGFHVMMMDACTAERHTSLADRPE